MTLDFGDLLAPRSVEDILAERVRLVIGEEVYDLPVLTIRENRAWREQVDVTLGMLLMAVSMEEDSDAILALFDRNEESLLALLQSYDRTGVLPPRETIEANLSPLGLVRAVLEVWRAARPLADIARTGLAAMPTETPPSSAPPINSWRRRTSSWLRNTAGRRDTSSAS